MFPVTIHLKNENDIIIRRAEKGDEKRYAEISNQMYLETRYLSRCEKDEFPSAESLGGFIEDIECSDKEILLFAVYNDTIIGSGTITACLNKAKMKHKCELDISILKAYWHLGIGKAIMYSLIEFARSAGYEQINLTVASDNDRAISLYEKLGFQTTGREVHAMKHADGDYSDWIFMTKFLV